MKIEILSTEMTTQYIGSSMFEQEPQEGVSFKIRFLEEADGFVQIGNERLWPRLGEEKKIFLPASSLKEGIYRLQRYVETVRV